MSARDSGRFLYPLSAFFFGVAVCLMPTLALTALVYACAGFGSAFAGEIRGAMEYFIVAGLAFGAALAVAWVGEALDRRLDAVRVRLEDELKRRAQW